MFPNTSIVSGTAVAESTRTPGKDAMKTRMECVWIGKIPGSKSVPLGVKNAREAKLLRYVAVESFWARPA